MKPSKEVYDGEGLLLTAARLREGGADPQPRDASEVTEVAGFDVMTSGNDRPRIDTLLD